MTFNTFACHLDFVSFSPPHMVHKLYFTMPAISVYVQACLTEHYVFGVNMYNLNGDIYAAILFQVQQLKVDAFEWKYNTKHYEILAAGSICS